MAYKYGLREQVTLLPQSIEDYIFPEDPVRVYDAFVEALDFQALGREWNEDKVGPPEYDPKAMLKLLVYGYSYGVRSSRKLERAVYHNLSFIWLVGGLKPDHKTIANFRRGNKTVLKKVLQLCARMCVKLSLMEGNTLFVDGTKIRANAGQKSCWTKERCERAMAGIEKRIEAILKECEATDEQEQENASLVKLNDKLAREENLKAKVRGILEELEVAGKPSFNVVDPECNRMRDHRSWRPGYNAQVVADEKNGLLVSCDVTSENNDLGQFASQINQAQETLGKPCQNAVADAGYAHTGELKKIDAQGVMVVVPSQRQVLHGEPRRFSKEAFQYDKENDYYLCPEGHRLVKVFANPVEKKISYDIVDERLCRQCQHWGECTMSKTGRRIMRLYDEAYKEKFEAQYQRPEAQALYALRKQKSELPFGHIKRNLNVDAFLLRGLEGVKAELSLMATCFNLSRMITMLGPARMIASLAA